MKKENGVTLIILVITIMVMSIIAGTVINQAMSNMQTQALSDLYSDLNTLQDKVNLYYIKYGAIPIKQEFTGSEDFKSFRNPNDNNNYYVIDLSKLENLTLKNKITDSGDDVYIINEETHTIYYPQGLEIYQIKYYRLPGTFTVIN